MLNIITKIKQSHTAVKAEQWEPIPDSYLVRHWLDALRGGRYEQGFFFLRPSDTTYCPLGVLCDIHDCSRWAKPIVWMYNGSAQYLPDDVPGLAPDPVIKFKLNGEVIYTLVSDLNDNFRFNFDIIAAIIEENIVERNDRDY